MRKKKKKNLKLLEIAGKIVQTLTEADQSRFSIP